MKTQVTTALQNYLDSLCEAGTGGETVFIDLYSIVLLSGAIMRLASWPIPVTYGGHTYSASGPYVSRSKIKQALKLEVSQISMKLSATPEMFVPGTSTPILAAIKQGLFAGAAVTVYRLVAQTAFPLDTTLGAVIWFSGNVAEIEELGRTHAKLAVKDPTALLSSPYPRNKFQTACRHTLFDSGCTLNASAYLKTGTVGSGATNVTIPTNLSASSYQGTLAPPTPKPTLSISGVLQGFNLQPENYFVVQTYVGPTGESAASDWNSLWVGDTRVALKVASPSSATGVTGWNCYVGNSLGNWQLQNAVPFPIGTPYEMGGQGLLQNVPPPYVNNSGYFTLGQITFTSGANAGISRFISQYTTPSGVATVTVLPPLPAAPASGDTFSILPGCDKQMSTCKSTKFSNNLVHFAGQPFIPIPQQAT